MVTTNKGPIHALGVWNAGDDRFHSILSPREAKDIIKASYRRGIRHFDTAFSYKGADSLLFSALRELGAKREEYHLWSKVMPLPTMEKKVEATLRRLGSEYLDILMLHWPTEEESLFESLKTLEHLQASGKAKEIGVSNFPLTLLEKCRKDFPISYHERPLSLIWNKDWQEEKKLPIKTIAYAPGGFGLLGGRYTPSTPPEDSRRDIAALSSPSFPILLEALSTLSEKYSVSPYSIALSWVEEERPWATAMGAGKVEHLDTKTIELSEEEKNTLERLAEEITSSYPMDNIFSHNWLIR